MEIAYSGVIAEVLFKGGDKIEKGEKPTQINRIGGSPTDGKSLIWPMKIMTGKQPYDPVNKTLVTPHTAGNDAAIPAIDEGPDRRPLQQLSNRGQAVQKIARLGGHGHFSGAGQVGTRRVASARRRVGSQPFSSSFMPGFASLSIFCANTRSPISGSRPVRR